MFDRRSLGVIDLHHGAAGEFNRQMKAARHDEEHRKNEGDKANRIQDQRVAHEGDGATDSEKFHDLLGTKQLPVARLRSRA